MKISFITRSILAPQEFASQISEENYHTKGFYGFEISFIIIPIIVTNGRYMGDVNINVYPPFNYYRLETYYYKNDGISIDKWKEAIVHASKYINDRAAIFKYPLFIEDSDDNFKIIEVS